MYCPALKLIPNQLIIQALTIPKKMKISPPAYHLKEWAATSFPMFLTALSESLFTIGGIILLRLAVDESSVAYYHAVWILTTIVLIPGKAVLAIASPLISRTFGDDQDRLNQIKNTSVKFLAVLSQTKILPWQFDF